MFNYSHVLYKTRFHVCEQLGDVKSYVKRNILYKICCSLESGVHVYNGLIFSETKTNYSLNYVN